MHLGITYEVTVAVPHPVSDLKRQQQPLARTDGVAPGPESLGLVQQLLQLGLQILKPLELVPGLVDSSQDGLDALEPLVHHLFATRFDDLGHERSTALGGHRPGSFGISISKKPAGVPEAFPAGTEAGRLGGRVHRERRVLDHHFGKVLVADDLQLEIPIDSELVEAALTRVGRTVIAGRRPARDQDGKQQHPQSLHHPGLLPFSAGPGRPGVRGSRPKDDESRRGVTSIR